jgi:hypothetical protein
MARRTCWVSSIGRLGTLRCIRLISHFVFPRIPRAMSKPAQNIPLAGGIIEK